MSKENKGVCACVLKPVKALYQLVFKLTKPTPKPQASADFKKNTVTGLCKAGFGGELQGPLTSAFDLLPCKTVNGILRRRRVDGTWWKEAGDPEHGQCLAFERFEKGGVHWEDAVRARTA